MLRHGDLRTGGLREESDIQYCGSLGCSVWGGVAKDGAGEIRWGWIVMDFVYSTKEGKGFQAGLA